MAVKTERDGEFVIRLFPLLMWLCSQPPGILDLLDGLLTLDCQKRMKADTALQLSWLRSAVGSFQRLHGAVSSLQPSNWSVL